MSDTVRVLYCKSLINNGAACDPYKSGLLFFGLGPLTSQQALLHIVAKLYFGWMYSFRPRPGVKPLFYVELL